MNNSLSFKYMNTASP